MVFVVNVATRIAGSERNDALLFACRPTVAVLTAAIECCWESDLTRGDESSCGYHFVGLQVAHLEVFVEENLEWAQLVSAAALWTGCQVYAFTTEGPLRRVTGPGVGERAVVANGVKRGEHEGHSRCSPPSGAGELGRTIPLPQRSWRVSSLPRGIDDGDRVGFSYVAPLRTPFQQTPYFTVPHNTHRAHEHLCDGSCVDFVEKVRSLFFVLDALRGGSSVPPRDPAHNEEKRGTSRSAADAGSRGKRSHVFGIIPGEPSTHARGFFLFSDWMHLLQETGAEALLVSPGAVFDEMASQCPAARFSTELPCALGRGSRPWCGAPPAEYHGTLPTAPPMAAGYVTYAAWLRFAFEHGSFINVLFFHVNTTLTYVARSTGTTSVSVRPHSCAADDHMDLPSHGPCVRSARVESGVKPQSHWLPLHWRAEELVLLPPRKKTRAVDGQTPRSPEMFSIFYPQVSSAAPSGYSVVQQTATPEEQGRRCAAVTQREGEGHVAAARLAHACRRAYAEREAAYPRRSYYRRELERPPGFCPCEL